jgi:peptidoglycan hydrolase-like protein with peptidoglycan-binding domain
VIFIWYLIKLGWNQLAIETIGPAIINQEKPMEPSAQLHFASVLAKTVPAPVSSSKRTLSQHCVRHFSAAILAATLPLLLATPGLSELTAYLREGSRGSQVIELQEILNDLGYYVRVDGIFSTETRSAVEQYQSNCGLAIDGIVGSDTRARLNRRDSCGRGGSLPNRPDGFRPGGEWVVIVPTDDPATLANVRDMKSDARIVRSSQFGPYIYVGPYSDKYGAENAYRVLQQKYGVRDAQMRYAPRFF